VQRGIGGSGGLFSGTRWWDLCNLVWFNQNYIGPNYVASLMIPPIPLSPRFNEGE
jgi:hypothetical protein